MWHSRLRTEPVRPITALILPPVILAVVQAGLGFFCLEEPPHILFSLGLGASIGLVGFGPVAAALVLRQRPSQWLFRHAFRIQWYASVLAMFSLGHMVASVRHRTYDVFAAVALLVVFVSAQVKVVLGIVCRPMARSAPPRGLDPPPPLKLVPRPSDGRPPTLSAAARVEAGDASEA